MSSSKPFAISKRAVWEAYLRVKANQGAAGVDGESIVEFERDLKGNLYKLWNRLSSGSYMPPPVRAVEIPKRGGSGVRTLGVPTVQDRIAQTVATLYLEPGVEPHFHPDSYGYRPGRSALDAVGACRGRCWRSDWVIDLDIRSFFSSVDHELMLKAVQRHTGLRWVLLYVERWLKAPLQREDGTLEQRDRGTPEGSAISPLLANLFLHYAFDVWIAREFPGVQFERYCDDAVVHCVSERQARVVLDAIAERLAYCRLELHAGKTHIVYCKDSNRHGSHEHEQFGFLGYTFRHDWRGARSAICSSASPRRSATRPRRRCAGRSSAGGCIAGARRPSPTLQGPSTGSCRVGRTITGASTRPSSPARSGSSTTTSFGGRCGNTNGCGATPPARLGS